MCHYIALIAPTDDAEAVRAVMARHGRDARPMDNPSVRKILREGERQYLAARGNCDCGTVLAPRRDIPEDAERKLADEAARLRRKGWSETKIARVLEDRRKAGARPGKAGPDSIALWDEVLGDLGRELRLPYAGLLVRMYSGGLDTETFDASRRQVAKNVSRQDALGAMAEDEATIFTLT